MSLASAHKKLTEHQFPLEDLPNDRNDSLWVDLRKDFGLTLAEVSALKNTVGGTMSPQQAHAPSSMVLSLTHLASIPLADLTETGKVLGEGQFSRVVSGIWTRAKPNWRGELKEPVAIKIPTIEFSPDVMRDLNVLANIPHQNILIAYGVTQSQPPRIVCEQMDTDLDRAIHEDKAINTRHLAIRVTRDIAAGLAHLHNSGIFHRDVKPKNVLLRKKPLQVKLCDFGCSKDVTKSLEVMSLAGTLGYLAPEVIAHKESGRASDVWSFAVLLYECITGERPPVIGKVSISRLQESSLCVEELATVFQACYQDDPRKRPSMAQVCEQLDSLLAQDGQDFDRMATALKIALAQDLDLYERVWNQYYSAQSALTPLLERITRLSNSFRSAPRQAPLQSCADLRALEALADSAENELHQALRDLTLGKMGTYVAASRKSRGRSQQKIDDEYGGDCARLLDLVRATALFHGAQEFDDCLHDLEISRDFELCRVKDRMNTPIESGYRDVLLNIRHPTGFVMELQMNFHRIAEIKSQAHRLYELSRVMKLKLVLPQAARENALRQNVANTENKSEERSAEQTVDKHTAADKTRLAAEKKAIDEREAAEKLRLAAEKEAADKREAAEKTRVVAEVKAADEQAAAEKVRVAAEKRATEERAVAEKARLVAEQRAIDEREVAENARLAAEKHAVNVVTKAKTSEVSAQSSPEMKRGSPYAKGKTALEVTKDFGDWKAAPAVRGPPCVLPSKIQSLVQNLEAANRELQAAKSALVALPKKGMLENQANYDRNKVAPLQAKVDSATTRVTGAQGDLDSVYVDVQDVASACELLGLKPAADLNALKYLLALLKLNREPMAVQITELKQGILTGSTQIQLGAKVAKAAVKAKVNLDTAEKVDLLFTFLKPFLSATSTELAALIPASEVWSYSELAAQLVSRLHHEDPEQHFTLLTAVRKHLAQTDQSHFVAGFTALVFDTLRLLPRAGGLQKKACGFVHESISVLFPHPAEAVPLWLQAALAADRLGLEDVAFESFTQAFICYEDVHMDSKSQYRVLTNIISTLHHCRGFGQEKYDTLASKATNYSAKLGDKSDQCRAVCACTHLFWSGEAPSPVREDKKVLACLRRALKIANSCPNQVVLFVEIFTQYLYFFDRRCPTIIVKDLRGVMALIEEHLPGLDGSEQSRTTKAHYWNTLRTIKMKAACEDEAGERYHSIGLGQPSK